MFVIVAFNRTMHSADQGREGDPGCSSCRIIRSRNKGVKTGGKSRLPDDFMDELEEEEIALVVSQNVIPHKKFFGGAKPFAFTETGVAMLSSVLKSEKAVEVNVAIIRTFVALRKIALNHQDIMRKLEQMKLEYDEKFADIFTALDYLFNPPEPKEVPRKRIGFKKD